MAQNETARRSNPPGGDIVTVLVHREAIKQSRAASAL